MNCPEHSLAHYVVKQEQDAFLEFAGISEACSTPARGTICHCRRMEA
eukprot:CAMPEP_0206142326 /NCGR_PEP_ID=MMETSP1473-20131121/16432_1 /ASSEMBLY_ACC=CAM_ASM_001109 /TAXON_ID=1461547 /ORGANISM="Stichococcus sp, Strain RCC1054" /LENGTH=46 /DNA_ID= /DNA_START= /DNA_END= /DNA_ORIENTATION=